MNKATKQKIDAIKELEKQIYEMGFEDGYAKGYNDGNSDLLEYIKPAISDGTRKGSSECAKVLRKYKKK